MRACPWPSRRAVAAGGLALAVALAPIGLRTVAPGVAARAHYEAVGQRLPYDHPLRSLIEALGPRSWEDPWGNRPGFDDEDLVCAGADGELCTADDVRLAGWVRRTWRSPPDGSFDGAAWWAFLVAPCLAAPAAAWLLSRRLGRGHPAHGRIRALATLVPPMMVLWLAGDGARRLAARLARDHLVGALPPLASHELVAWGSVVVGLWVPLLCLDLALTRREAVA